MLDILRVFFILVHIVTCVGLIVAILLQSGKGGGLSSAFGVGAGGGLETMFGGRRAATLLVKITTVLAVVFVITSFSLAIMANKVTVKKQKSAIESTKTPVTPQPTTPK